VKTPPRRLLLPLGLGLVALLLWDTFVVYPFRLFVVFLHEISHGLAAVLTGGRIVSIGLSFDEGGVCLTRGGSTFLVLNAGYLGSLLWGAVFLVLGTKRRQARSVIAAVGLFTLVVTLLYVRTWFGFFYGLAASLALVLVASRLKPVVSEVLLATLGAMSCLYAVWDIASDVLLRTAAESDASALARLTGLPALLWGALWIGLSLVVLAAVLRRLA
jgi:Peptidase M50B-like